MSAVLQYVSLNSPFVNTNPVHPVLPKDIFISAFPRPRYQREPQNTDQSPQPRNFSTSITPKIKTSETAKHIALSYLRICATWKFQDEICKKKVKELDFEVKKASSTRSMSYDWEDYKKEMIEKKINVTTELMKKADQFSKALAEESNKVIWDEEKGDWRLKDLGADGPLLPRWGKEMIEDLIVKGNYKVSEQCLLVVVFDFVTFRLGTS